MQGDSNKSKGRRWEMETHLGCAAEMHSMCETSEMRRELPSLLWSGLDVRSSALGWTTGMRVCGTGSEERPTWVTLGWDPATDHSFNGNKWLEPSLSTSRMSWDHDLLLVGNFNLPDTC